MPEPGLSTPPATRSRSGARAGSAAARSSSSQAEIKQDTEALDQVLGTLGRDARTAASTAACSPPRTGDHRRRGAHDLATSRATSRSARKAEETAKFVDVERERNTKVTEAERVDEEAKGARDARGPAPRPARQAQGARAAPEGVPQGRRGQRHARPATPQMGETRGELRRSAERHRREAAALEPDRQDVDRRLAALERPIDERQTKVDAAQGRARRREAQPQRRARGPQPPPRRARCRAEAQVARDRAGRAARSRADSSRSARSSTSTGSTTPSSASSIRRIDRLRSAITSRTTEIEKLTAEREAYDRGHAGSRGCAALGGAVVLLITLIVIILALDGGQFS